MQWQEDKVLLKKTGQLMARTNGSPDSSIPGYLVTLLLKKFVTLGAPRKCPTNVAQHYTNQSTNNPQIHIYLYMEKITKHPLYVYNWNWIWGGEE